MVELVITVAPGPGCVHANCTDDRSIDRAPNRFWWTSRTCHRGAAHGARKRKPETTTMAVFLLQRGAPSPHPLRAKAKSSCVPSSRRESSNKISPRLRAALSSALYRNRALQQLASSRQSQPKTNIASSSTSTFLSGTGVNKLRMWKQLWRNRSCSSRPCVLMAARPRSREEQGA